MYINIGTVHTCSCVSVCVYVCVHVSNLDALWTGLTRAAEQLSSQQVSVVLQEGQIKVPEKLHVFVLHAKLLRRVPVDHLRAEVTR